MTPLVDSLYFQIGLGVGLALGLAAIALQVFRHHRQHHASPNLVELINQELPQTQCGHCSYPGCLSYASAIANGEATNKCVPGGAAIISRLSMLLNQPLDCVDPAHGQPGPRLVAVIREAECIGCTKCIQACPVDAILGAAKLMHTVIAHECNGCDLCVEPCPVDCIDLVPARKHDPRRQLAASFGSRSGGYSEGDMDTGEVLTTPASITQRKP